MLNTFTAFNPHMKPLQMKEQIKCFGIAAEVLGEELVPCLPRIFQNLTKLMKEEPTSRLHEAIAEAVGLLVYHTIEGMPSDDDK